MENENQVDNNTMMTYYKQIKYIVQDSFYESCSNVKIEGLKRKEAKPAFFDLSNFTATYVYNEITKQNVTVEQSINRQLRFNLQYAYAFKNPITLTPFQNLNLFKSKHWALIKDFNLQLMPNNIGFILTLIFFQKLFSSAESHLIQILINFFPSHTNSLICNT